MIFISKDFLKTFTIKINGKRRSTSTNNVHTYIHTDRETDIHTYTHNFYHLLNSGGVKNRFCDSCNTRITMKASLGFIAIFAVNIYIYTAFRT